jgi:hypothetical protein
MQIGRSRARPAIDGEGHRAVAIGSTFVVGARIGNIGDVGARLTTIRAQRQRAGPRLELHRTLIGFNAMAGDGRRRQARRLGNLLRRPIGGAIRIPVRVAVVLCRERHREHERSAEHEDAGEGARRRRHAPES